MNIRSMHHQFRQPSEPVVSDQIIRLSILSVVSGSTPSRSATNIVVDDNIQVDAATICRRLSRASVTSYKGDEVTERRSKYTLMFLSLPQVQMGARC